MHLIFVLLAFLVAAMSAGPVAAVEPDEILKDVKQEQRARDISANLRCLVCQNQSIDDSNAQLAKDLRILVRERITAGDTDNEVVDYLVNRYGEFVLLQPRFALHTLILWLSAPVVLLIGLIALFFAYRKRKTAAVDGATSVSAELSEEEKAALESVLKEK